MSFLDEPIPEPPPGRGVTCPDCGARAWSDDGLSAHRREAHGVKAAWEVAADQEAEARRRQRRTQPRYERGASAGGLRRGQVVRRKVGRTTHPARWVVVETGLWLPDDNPRRPRHPAFLARPEDGDLDDCRVFANSEAVT